MPLKGNMHVLHFSQEPEDTQKQRLTNREPQFMTLTLKLDPISATIGTKLPKDDRHTAHGPLEMFEDSFQVSLPESSELSDENNEEDRAEDTAEDHAKEPSPAPETVREDASERLPSPTPRDMQAEPSVSSSATADSTTTLRQWQSDGHAELMFLNPVQYSYPSFPPQYPSNLAFSDPFVFENCSAGFSGAHSLLGSSGLTCSFPFPDSRHDLGPGSMITEDRQHFVDTTLGLMGAAPFNLENTGGVPNAYGRIETLQDSRSSSTQQDDARNTSVSRHNTEQGRNSTEASDTNVEVPHRPIPDESDLQETTETRPGNRRKPRRTRKQKQPPIKSVQIPSIPSLPTLPSLPSIFPPEWHGSNVMEGRVPMEHTGNRRFAPLLPAVSPREPTPPPPSLVGHPNSSMPHYLPTSYPPLLLDRTYPQTTLPPEGCAPGMATLRPAIWPMPPPMLLQADSRHGLSPGQLTPMFAQGPGEVCLPGIGQFSYMSGLPSASLQSQSSGGHHWTTHFDFLQDELHERMRLQKIQDKFNRKNNICGKASTKRRMLTHPCPLCDRSFMRRNSLAIHMKWHYKPREGSSFANVSSYLADLTYSSSRDGYYRGR